MRTRRAPLGLELLEDRRVPAAFGTAWPDPARLTLSFPGDGTALGVQQSQLYETLNANANTRDWQLAVLRAFQTWAVNANLNIGLVADGGQPLGATGPLQGDERFGDIRIAARALDQAALAVATPFDVTAGTWSGDVTLNSNHAFGPGAGQFDVFTVLLHESGHVFGVGGSSDSNSAMYQQYRGARAGLSPTDIRNLQTLYGVRQPDANDAERPNDTINRATHIDYDFDGLTITTTIVAGDITTLDDIDWYRFDGDGDLESMTLTVSTAGMSLLAPRLTVYDEDMEIVDAAFVTDPLSGGVSIVLDDVDDERFWLKVEGATADVFGIGSYELRVTPGPDDGDDDDDDDYLNDDHGGDDDFQTAAILPQQYRRTDLRFDYAYEASLSVPGDVDFYRIRAPQAASDAKNVMSVMAWGLDAVGLQPTVQVYNRRLKPIEAKVLVNENGAYTLQLAGAQSNRDYFVAVHAADPTRNLGDYFVGIDFGLQKVKLPTYENATLTAGNRQVVRTLEVNETQLVHLTLSAAGNNASGVRLTVYDTTGRVLHTFVASSGSTQTTTLLLERGAYAFHFAGGTRDGSTLMPLSYRLRVLGLSDPIGPQPIDTTLQPPSPTNPPPTTGPGTVWSDFALYAFLSMSGPYSSPW